MKTAVAVLLAMLVAAPASAQYSTAALRRLRAEQKARYDREFEERQRAWREHIEAKYKGAWKKAATGTVGPPVQPTYYGESIESMKATLPGKVKLPRPMVPRKSPIAVSTVFVNGEMFTIVQFKR